METQSVDMVTLITNTINTLFSNLFSSIDTTLYSLLDDLVFITPDILQDSYFDKLLGSPTEGMIAIANAFILGFILYYAIHLMLSYLTLSQIQRPSQFILKLILFGIAMNSTAFLCEQLLFFNTTISSAIREVGEILFSKQICFSSFIEEINKNLSLGTDFNLFSFHGLLKSLVSFGLLNLVISYSLRYILIKVFLLLCPFAILSLATDHSAWFFKAWLRSFLSLLFLQILIAIILLICFSIDFSSQNLFSNLLFLGSIYALIKANSILREFIGGISTDIQTGISSMRTFLSSK